jgi:LmbE family N-acetylglucosaminyl deacetylase
MKLPDRLLFVGAHCDDIELFAGGLIAKACRLGRRVGVLAFSDHRGVVTEEQAAQAQREFHENVAWLQSQFGASIQNHSERFIPACCGHFESERGALYKALEALRDAYDLVITHSATDTNQDHQQVASEAARVFKSHCSLWAGEFPSNDLGDFSPQVFVALEPEDLNAKVKLVSNYRSQQFDGRPYFDEAVIRGLAAVRGAQIRTAAAEAFCAVRIRS